MQAGEAFVGQPVVYRPHPGAPAEDGEVTEVREAGTVMVRYIGDRGAKATHLRDLAPARPRRLRSCVEAWPEAETMMYDPRCCRFPKSCSATVYSYEHVTEADLEPRAELSTP